MKRKEYRIKQKLPKLKSLLESCVLCPRQCKINRLEKRAGACNAGLKPAVYSYSPHHGEEPPLSGVAGSGTIFFTHCNMGCVYCQNYKFSQLSDHAEMTAGDLADIMLELQSMRCHNINLVSPTHYVPQITEALLLAIEKGLTLPVVYNTGGYDSLEVIKLLDGIIDIYLPDMRYNDDKMAAKYSNAPNYVGHNRKCVAEMQRQVGDLMFTGDDIAIKGLIVRCLVLPGSISGTDKTLEFIAASISKNAYISLMSQFYPVHRAFDFDELSRRITDHEYKKVIDKLEELGFNNGWVQASPSGMGTSFGEHRLIKPR